MTGIDLYASDAKIRNIGRFFNLPTPPHLPACDQLGLPQPPVFIVSCLIPGYEPSNPLWGKAVDDGRGYCLMFVFTLSDNSLEEWAKPLPSTHFGFLFAPPVCLGVSSIDLIERSHSFLMCRCAGHCFVAPLHHRRSRR